MLSHTYSNVALTSSRTSLRSQTTREHGVWLRETTAVLRIHQPELYTCKDVEHGCGGYYLGGRVSPSATPDYIRDHRSSLLLVERFRRPYSDVYEVHL